MLRPQGWQLRTVGASRGVRVKGGCMNGQLKPEKASARALFDPQLHSLIRVWL